VEFTVRSCRGRAHTASCATLRYRGQRQPPAGPRECITALHSPPAYDGLRDGLPRPRQAGVLGSELKQGGDEGAGCI